MAELYPRSGVITRIRRDVVARWNCEPALAYYDEITGGADEWAGEWTPMHSAMLGARSPAFLRTLEKAGTIPKHPGVFRLAVERGLSR